MQQLHSYWRMPYIEIPKEGDCKNPFLKMAKSTDLEANLVLTKGKYTFIVMNKFPYNCGHLLVLPLREIADIDELSKEEFAEFFEYVAKAKALLKKVLKPDAFNIGMNLGAKAGAGIPTHLHCHIVPRWDGDTNFMPVIANTKVLPEAMQALYKKLVEAL